MISIYVFIFQLVNGQIIGWTEWSACPISCSAPGESAGLIRRTAICENDPDCEIEETMDCHPPECGSYCCPWADWSDCVGSCDEAERTREPDCNGNESGPVGCIVQSKETISCAVSTCGWTGWQQSGECSGDCSTGTYLLVTISSHIITFYSHFRHIFITFSHRHITVSIKIW